MSYLQSAFLRGRRRAKIRRALGCGVMGVLAAAFIVAPSIAFADYPPYYFEPAYASPHAAALGPWPFNFDIGGGPTPVLGGARSQLSSGSNFIMGGGYNFTPRMGFVLEYMNSWLGMTNASVQSNAAISGDANVWGITLNPIWRFRISGPIGGYFIGGGGYYERDLHLVQPFTFTFQNHLGQTVTATGNAQTQQDTGAGGINIGTGITWNFAWGTKLFMEVRYHYLFTSGYATQILPITVGLRW